MRRAIRWVPRIILLLTLGGWFAADFAQPKIFLFQRGQPSSYTYRQRPNDPIISAWTITAPHRLCAWAGKNSFWLGWERSGAQFSVKEEPYLSFAFSGEDWGLVRPIFSYYDDPDPNQIEYIYYGGSTRPVIRPHGPVTLAERRQWLSIGIPYWMPAGAMLLLVLWAEWRRRRPSRYRGFVRAHVGPVPARPLD